MSDGHGGHRTPSNPAPASGPGKLSRRTDGGPAQKLMAPTGMDYGAHKALMAQERTAPMSQADSVKPAKVPAQQAAAPGTPPSVTPLDAPSNRPDEPVTHGVDIGDGAGSEIFANYQPPTLPTQGRMSQMLGDLAARDRTGVLANLYQSALSLGA